MLNTLLSRMSQILPPTGAARSVFIILFAIGVFVRTAGLTWGIPDWNNQSSVYHDEGHVLSYVNMSWENFRREFGEYEIVRPVYLYRLVGRPLFALGSALDINNPQNRIYEIATLRSITALFGIAGLVAVYALGRQIASYKTGLWAMAFLTFMPAHWYYSQILKGDLMVATLFTLILICAIHIARTGRKTGYIWGAIILGAGTSFKATTMVAAPVLLLGHILYIWKTGRWGEVANSNAILCLLSAVVSFALLYPYPFYDFAQFKYLIDNPSIQHLTPRYIVSPSTYLATIRQYHSPDRPFFEMIFGKFLLWAFLPSLFVVLGMAVYKATRRQIELLIIVALLTLFFHSLTFSDALDERYILPFAPFAALFPALVITWISSLPNALYTKIGVVTGTLLVGGTAAITGVLFPSFAFSDPRRDAVEWIRSSAPADSTIAQATQTSRWALVFDSSSASYNNNTFAYGSENERHIAQLITPDYIVLQQEPWNYDHTFRYELAGIDKEKELFPLLKRYQEHKVFGRVPTLFGWRIPQTLGSPVIHIYADPQTPEITKQKTYKTLNSSPVAVAQKPPIGEAVHFTIGVPPRTPNNAQNTYLGITVQNEFSAPAVTRQLEEPTVLQPEENPALVIRLLDPEIQSGTEISFIVFSPRPNQTEFYIVSGGRVSFYGAGYTPDDATIFAFVL